MKFFEKIVVLWAVCCCALITKAGVRLQDSIVVPITSADAFERMTPNWVMASNVAMDMTNSKVKYEKGFGILLCKAGTDANPIVLKEKVSGDIELALDFMVSMDGDPALYFLGKHQISLGGDKIGTVEVNAHAENPLLRVRTPVTNVAKAPGLWQHLKIRYRTADHYIGEGIKESRPSFEAIYLNGVLIHQQLYIEPAAPNNGDAVTNSLLSFACSNGSVAFRNIHYRKLPAATEPAPPTDPAAARRFYRVVNPIVLNPGTRPYFLRSYLMFEGKKRTHVISVGHPNHANFSYDLKQGALLQVWKGEFVDVTSMWESRGEPQTAAPLGALVEFTAKPTIAVLKTTDENWPDSIAFDEMHNKGYSIDATGVPTFQYEFLGMHVDDRLSYHTDGNSLTRALTVSNLADNANCLVAVGRDVTSLSKELYAVNDKSYYVRIDKRFGAFVRKTPNGEELIVPISPNGGHVTYSLIW